MDPILFTPGESVLLIGEGNFSFAVGLQKLGLLITITATCFESKVDLARETLKSANIFHLQQTGVRVLLGVNGTELAKNPILKHEKFSKIIFNFPHVGGKMKIHLNKILLKEFFENVYPFLNPDGRVLISLCKGQGGTAADVPRRWEDTWQIVEMAAHGDFILCAMEPFLHQLVPDYSSVGYRSRDTSFHTDNALVHIFKKVDALYSNTDVNTLQRTTEPQILSTNYGDIVCPSTYAFRYQENLRLLGNTNYPIPYLLQELKQSVEIFQTKDEERSTKTKYISENEVPIHVVETNGNYQCITNNTENRCELRQSLMDVLDSVLPIWLEQQSINIVFPGTVFNKQTGDFDSPPVSSHVLLLGNDAQNMCSEFLNGLVTPGQSIKIFSEETENKYLSLPDIVKLTLNRNIVLSEKEGNIWKHHIVGQECALQLRHNGMEVLTSIIFLDKLAHALYRIRNWRELWANGACVATVDNTTVFKPASLHQKLFELDFCFSDPHTFEEKEFFHVLWQIAGDIITNVSKPFNEYASLEGWQSRCYRVSYQSFDKALHRSKIIDIHQNIIGKILTSKLGVKMH